MYYIIYIANCFDQAVNKRRKRLRPTFQTKYIRWFGTQRYYNVCAKKFNREN